MKYLIPFLRSEPPLSVELEPQETAPRSRVESARDAIMNSRNRLVSVETYLESEIARLNKELDEARVVLAASDAFAAALDQAELKAAE